MVVVWWWWCGGVVVVVVVVVSITVLTYRTPSHASMFHLLPSQSSLDISEMTLIPSPCSLVVSLAFQGSTVWNH